MQTLSRFLMLKSVFVVIRSFRIVMTLERHYPNTRLAFLYCRLVDTALFLVPTVRNIGLLLVRHVAFLLDPVSRGSHDCSHSSCILCEVSRLPALTSIRPAPIPQRASYLRSPPTDLSCPRYLLGNNLTKFKVATTCKQRISL